MASQDFELEILKRLTRETGDPRGQLLLFILQAGRPVSRLKMIELLRMPEYAVDRALTFLYEHGLIDKIQTLSTNGKEAVYFVTGP